MAVCVTISQISQPTLEECNFIKRQDKKVGLLLKSRHFKVKVNCKMRLNVKLRPQNCHCQQIQRSFKEETSN